MKTLILMLAFLANDIYSLQYESIDGQQMSMNTFQGKQILLVNIATNSPLVNQLQGLQTLHEQYGDSVVIIAIPSNSFGNEPRTNAEIKTFCESNYQTSFRMSSKSIITGSGMSSVYQWLSSKSANGVADVNIRGDFQKVLVASDGTIKAIYSSKLDPTHPEIIQGITTSN